MSNEGADRWAGEREPASAGRQADGPSCASGGGASHVIVRDRVHGGQSEGVYLPQYLIRHQVQDNRRRGRHGGWREQIDDEAFKGREYVSTGIIGFVLSVQHQ